MTSPYLPGRLGFASPADIDEFVATLRRYERGELSADAWRAFRLVRGVYGQRQPGVQMLRVKIPQGILGPAQLRALAAVAATYGDGRCHITTRQNAQFYQLDLGRVEAAMRDLATVGLTTREACGHSVRNVTACPLAGVDAAAVFDVTPYADALTRYLLRGPLSSTLPRKFKIAFEGCHRDCVKAAINDLGFVARRDAAGQRGFLVLGGGGLSTLPRSAPVLVQFLPAGELLGLSEAVVRVFHREGDRKNKKKARLKWVIQRLGFPAFRDAVLAEWAAIRATGAPPLPFDPQEPPVEPAPPPHPLALLPPETAAPEPSYAAFTRSNVVAQLQPGRVTVLVRLRLGDLSTAQLLGMAELIVRFGDGTLRATADQNLAVRHVPEAAVPALYRALHELGLGDSGAGSFADVVSCPGADTCAIAVTASRGMGRLLGEHLSAQPTEPGTAGARIHISGCPNGCGQHHVATIGLQGALRKIGNRPVPAYQLTVGGGGSGDVAQFGRLIGKIPARSGPQAIERLLALWRRERQPDESLQRFYARVPIDQVRRTLVELLEVDEHSLTPEDYIDLGQQAPFAVGETETEGECAA